jgi:hypothetical protein
MEPPEEMGVKQYLEIVLNLHIQFGMQRDLEAEEEGHHPLKAVQVLQVLPV